MSTYNLPNSASFLYELDGDDDVATLGNNSGSGIVLGAGKDTIYVGAGGQIAEAGAGGASLGDTFVIGTDGSASHATVAGSAESELCGTELQGGSGVNTLKIVGGTWTSTSSGPVDNAVDLNSAFLGLKFSNITNIVIDNANTDINVDNGLSYKITAGGGDNSFDLTCAGWGTSLVTTGSGSDTVWMGSPTQVVSLGTGANNVYVNDFLPLSHALINGGNNTSSASSTLWISEVSGTFTESVTPSVDTYISNGNAVMGNGIVGFKTVVLDTCYDGELVTNVTDMAGASHGMVVYGSTYGGDYVVLNQTNQGYVGNYDNSNSSGSGCDNTVVLNAGVFNAGVTLDGGVQSDDSTLVLAQGGAYNFTTATIKDFGTVDVEANATNLTLNAGNTRSDGTQGYWVQVNAGNAEFGQYGCSSSGPIIESIVGASGSKVENDIDIESNGVYGNNYFDAIQFASGSVINGGTGPDEVLDIGYNCDSSIDLSKATVSNIEAINIDNDSTLILTSDQISALDTALLANNLKYANNPPLDPESLIEGCCGTLVVDMSPDTPYLNVSSLDLNTFESEGGTVVVDDSLSSSVTIEGSFGNEGFVLNSGTGTAWVNAGSGRNEIYTLQGAASNSTLIAGDGACNTFYFDATSSTTAMKTDDTIVAPTSGSLTVYTEHTGSSGTGAVDFTGATFANFGSNATIYVDNNTTAVFTASQFNALADEDVTFAGSGTIEVLVPTDPAQTLVTNSFSGAIVLDADPASATSGTFTVDASNLSSASSVTVEGNSNFWNGYWEIIGGSTYGEVVFDNPGGTTVNVDDRLVGNGGDYTLDVVTNTNFAPGGTALISHTVAEVLMTIAGGTTATVDSAQINGAHAGLQVQSTASTFVNEPTSDAHLVIQVSTGIGFTQSEIAILPDIIGSPPNNNPYNLDETVVIEPSASGSSATPVIVDLRATSCNDYLTITVNGASAGSSVTVYAGLGDETLTGGASADTFVFDDPMAESGCPAVITDTINGGLGSNYLQIGDASGSDVSYDFTGSSLTSLQTIEIFSNATAVFDSYPQLDGGTVNNSGTLVVEINEPSNLFSLVSRTISHVAVSANFTLNGSGAVVLYDDMSGSNTVAAGSWTETIYDGSQTESIYAGTGSDTIVVWDGGSGKANLYGDGSGSSVDFDFTYCNNTTNTPIPTNYKVGGEFDITTTATKDFYADTGTINGMGALASITIAHDTNLAGATISGINNVYIDGGDSLALSYAQIKNFASAGTVLHDVGGSSSNLVIQATAYSTNPIVFTGTTATWLDGWSGTLTIVDVGHGLVDASGLYGGDFAGTVATSATTILNDHGVAIYGAAGDTIYGSGNNGDYIQGGGTGTHIVIAHGTDDTLFSGYGSGNVIEFTSTATSAAGDIIHGGGSTNETLQIDGQTDFTDLFLGDNANNYYDGLNAIENFKFNNLNNSGTYWAAFDYDSLEHDLVTLSTINGAKLSLVDKANTSDQVTFEVDGAGNIDLRPFSTANFTTNILSGGDATVLINDTAACSSVTVYGTNNGVNTGSYTQAGDTILVNGYGDTVIVGSGANIVEFESGMGGLSNGNVANDVHFVANSSGSTMNVGDASNVQLLGAMGNLVDGLHNAGNASNAGTYADPNFGYVDLKGFSLSAPTPTVKTTPEGSGALDGANGFGTYGVIEDSTLINPGADFLIGSGSNARISSSGVYAAAGNIEANFTDTSRATEKGFMTVADAAGDVALFYINTTGSGGGANHTVAATDIHLVGVFDDLISAGTAAVNSSFFHIHS